MTIDLMALNRKKILILCMGDSPHAIRWINYISKVDYDVHVYPCTIYGVINGLSDVTIHSTFASATINQIFSSLRRNKSFRLNQEFRKIYESRFSKKAKYDFILPFPITLSLERFLSKINEKVGHSQTKISWLYGSFFINLLIHKLKPDLIHTMEFQHNGYRLFKSKTLYRGDFPKWLATNWGSDIYYYQHSSSHLKDIKQILNTIDYYSCECQRDIRLAKKLGMTCLTMPVTVNSGGFNIKDAYIRRTQTKASQRRVILIKGYQHFAGRAITALRALALANDILCDYKIIIFSASEATIKEAQLLKSLNLIPNFEVVNHTSHDNILDLHSHARIYLGISKSDAISTSILEAMAMGAFPIQSNTSCCSEWIKNEETGFIVPYDDINKIAECIKRAILDDQLVDNAYNINWQTVQERLDDRVISKDVANIYSLCIKNTK